MSTNHQRQNAKNDDKEQYGCEIAAAAAVVDLLQLPLIACLPIMHGHHPYARFNARGRFRRVVLHVLAGLPHAIARHRNGLQR